METKEIINRIRNLEHVMMPYTKKEYRTVTVHRNGKVTISELGNGSNIVTHIFDDGPAAYEFLRHKIGNDNDYIFKSFLNITKGFGFWPEFVFYMTIDEMVHTENFPSQEAYLTVYLAAERYFYFRDKELKPGALLELAALRKTMSVDDQVKEYRNPKWLRNYDLNSGTFFTQPEDLG